MKSLRSNGIVLAVIAIGVVGCGPTEFNITKNPSYADLVVTYNAEVQALDNLEKKRKELVTEFTNQAQVDLVKSAFESLGSKIQSSIPSSPNAALDQAVAAEERRAQLSTGLLERLAPTPASGTASSAANTDYPEEMQRKLSELDAEIVKQTARVERARIARDAAEAK